MAHTCRKWCDIGRNGKREVVAFAGRGLLPEETLIFGPYAVLPDGRVLEKTDNVRITKLFECDELFILKSTR